MLLSDFHCKFCGDFLKLDWNEKISSKYQTIVNQMGEYLVNNIEKAKSSSESFLELFVNRQVQIYNDLDPAHKLTLGRIPLKSQPT